MLGLLLEAVAGEMPAGAEEEPPAACPRCGCPRTVRRGRDAEGEQRRLCRGCGRSFRASTGRVLGTTKLPAATWARYAELMLAGATLRGAAAGCGVSLKTSFSMRHRLCEVMASMLPAFEAGPGAEVQADETLVPDSLSGNHSRSAGFPCPAPHAGAGGAPEVRLVRPARAAQPRQRPALRAQGVPREVQGSLHQAPPELPLVVLLGARGPAGRRRRLAAAGPDGVGGLPHQLEGTVGDAVPLPPGDLHAIGGLTQPTHFAPRCVKGAASVLHASEPFTRAGPPGAPEAPQGPARNRLPGSPRASARTCPRSA